MLRKRNEMIPGSFPETKDSLYPPKHRYLVHKIKSIWRRNPTTVQQENHQTLNLSLTVNNHYHYQHEGKTSIVQQIVVLPPAQMYSLMALVALFLVIVGIALLQVHRTISILERLIDGLVYIVFSSASGLGSVVKWIQYCFM